MFEDNVPEPGSADAMIEDGFVSIATGLYRLRNEGKTQEAIDAIGTIFNLLREDLEAMR